jgi:hypothetical protein
MGMKIEMMHSPNRVLHSKSWLLVNKKAAINNMVKSYVRISRLKRPKLATSSCKTGTEISGRLGAAIAED